MAGGGQRGEISRCVPTVVAGADVDVVDVAQDAAAGTLGDRGKEFPLGNARMLEAQIRGRVLDQDTALEIRLGPIHVAADEVERFLGHGQRQQVGKVRTADDAPRKMLGDEPRFEAFDDAPDTIQMGAIKALGAAERKPDAMQRDGIVATDGVEIGERRAAPHVVLGVNFQPSHFRPRIEDRLMVLKAQPDPRRGRDRAASLPPGGPGSHARDAHADVFPPWILLQSPAGSSTNDFGSRACVAWPAHECAPSAQSFLAAALMP